MFLGESARRFINEIKNLFPLFRYLVLQTETHAFCLALACAALLGLFPASVAFLTFFWYVLHWDAAYNVLLDTLLDPTEHHACHEEVTWVEQREGERPEQARPVAGSRAHDQSRYTFVFLIEHEHPAATACWAA